MSSKFSTGVEGLESRILLSAVDALAAGVLADDLNTTSSNSHFESLLSDSHHHASFSLRDPQQYIDYANGSFPVGRITYDEILDAAKITFPAGSGEGSADLGAHDYLRLPFSELRKGVDREVSIQWEARWSKEFVGIADAGLRAHKAFRLDHAAAPGGDSRRFEIQTRYSHAATGQVALPTIRAYYGVIGGDGNNDPLSADGRKDFQPGGQAEYFDIAPDTWTRFTLSVTWHDGEQRIRLWMADENRDPVLVLADPDDPTKGFLADGGPEQVVGLDRFLVLFDTSQSPGEHPELNAWVRNVVVFKDATVPLGGRPGVGEPVPEPEPEPEPEPVPISRFDFGTHVSAVADGYTPVIRTTRYDDGSGRSYGWLNDIRMYDRGTSDPLKSDFHYGNEGTFVIDLANGTYDVTLTLGDNRAPRDRVSVSIEGRQVDLVSTAKGQFYTAVYRVEVTDGQLSVLLRDLGGVSNSFAVNALTVDAARQNATGVYYVSTTGSDSTDGTRESPFRTIGHALDIVQPGETIVIQPGTYAESLATQVAGAADKRIVVRAESNGTVVITQPGNTLSVDHPYYSFIGLVFDGRFGTSDIISVSSNGDALHLIADEIRNGRRDGIDLTNADDVLIKNSRVHSLLWFDTGEQYDAHGIVTSGGKNLYVRETEVYYVSGDALQLQYGGWDHAVVESSHFWNGPLPAELAAAVGAPVGSRLGEDAIDVKQYGDVPAGRLNVIHTVFNGWHSDFISNASAMNLKHNVDVVVDGNTFFDNEIALRLRGPGAMPNARVLVTNNIFHSNQTAIRYEDGIEDLRIYNNTFGGGNGRFFQSAGGHGDGFSVQNNLFFSPTPPREASASSNLAVDATAFVDAAAHDYHLASGSAAIDAGIEIPSVAVDHDGNQRPVNGAFDVGAFEAALESLYSIDSDSLLLGTSP